jgi:hypothetical protein
MSGIGFIIGTVVLVKYLADMQKPARLKTVLEPLHRAEFVCFKHKRYNLG